MLELRREGKSYQQIADRVGLPSPASAQRIVSRAIKVVLRETAEEVRSIELSRLEMMIELLWDSMAEDIKGKQPDFRRLDRVKALIESKLRFCGAVPVVEEKSSHFTQIIINKFTDAAPTPPREITEQQKTIESLPIKPLEARDVTSECPS